VFLEPLFFVEDSQKLALLSPLCSYEHSAGCTARKLGYCSPVKFFIAVAAYLVMGVILCAGILQAVHGSYWLLGFSVLGYLVLLGLVGCLPPQ
jgi:hypothetical protein